MGTPRQTLIDRLETARNSKVLLFITGDRPGLETQIASDAYDLVVHHIDAIGLTQKITLYLYTRGGNTLTAWSLVNLIRQFCEDFEVVIPSKAHSAGTLMSLGADRIVMTKQATLGPIDPTLNHPLNPQIPGRPPEAKASVSVEEINGFIELAKRELGIKEPKELSDVLTSLTQTYSSFGFGSCLSLEDPDSDACEEVDHTTGIRRRKNLLNHQLLVQRFWKP